MGLENIKERGETDQQLNDDQYHIGKREISLSDFGLDQDEISQEDQIDQIVIQQRSYNES